MANISHILGHDFTPPTQKQPDPPEQQLRDAIIQAGMTPPDVITLDGRIHRFSTGTRGPGRVDHAKTGWYVAYSDGVPAGRFGCWRAGVEIAWRADVGRSLTPAEEMANVRRQAEAKALRDAERQRTQDMAANTVATIWESAGVASADHPYLARKGIQPHGARVTGDGRLAVPLYSPDGELASLQYIDPDGSKLYHSGGKTGGCFWSVGTSDEPGAVYVAEGFATAATISEATGRICFVAYSASNLVPVTGTVRGIYGDQQDVVIVADNDESGTGQKYADQASAKYGARVIIPPMPGMDANDYAQAGHDLTQLLMPHGADDWLISADEFSQQPAPIKWLIRDQIQSDALIMVHGPSGGGKTFVVLDMCLRMASGGGQWCGLRASAANVVYLAGEGHHGLRGRIAAWKSHHQAQSLSMWVSKSGLDLNTAQGYQRAADALRALKEKPDLIVVDTLHRFLSGDENSAQDAKTMLDACAGLQAEFGCSVLLVHHTGVSDEAQHRARGSSAWRGALDIEISVVPAKGDAPMEVVQRKSKDAELAREIYGKLRSVPVPGWVDEDAEQVKSAVFEPCEAPPKKADKQDTKQQRHIKMFEAAWWDSGTEERIGKPYLSRSAFINYLIEKQDVKPSSANMYVKPSAAGKPVADLLLQGLITEHEHGWVFNDAVIGSAWLMSKNAR